MKTITEREDLIQFLGQMRGPIRAKIVTRTLVRMNKKDVATKLIANPYADVYKVQTTEVELCCEYEAKVNDQLLIEDKMPTFEAEAMQWGKHVNKAIIEHNGGLYLQTIPVAHIGEAVYETVGGAKVDVAVLQPFMPPYRPSQKQELDEEVKVRTYKLESIIGLNIDNKVRFVCVQ